MKKVLIITYYWPPAGGVQVHRVVKFCKYLREYGWEPSILTVKGGTYDILDKSLAGEVEHIQDIYRAPALEPHHLFNLLTRSRKQHVETPGPSTPDSGNPRAWAHWLGEFIRLNVFIPDARIGWHPYAVRRGKQVFLEKEPDLLFSTAPPYTVHLVARSLQRRFATPWVADFRDPWVENYAYNTTYRFPWIRSINQRMEYGVLRAADRVITATPGQLDLQAGKLQPSERHKFRTITNGYDSQGSQTPGKSDRFNLSYYGWISAQRCPITLLRILRNLCQSDPQFSAQFTLRIIGRHDAQTASILKKHIPDANLDLRPPVPYDELQPMLYEDQLMLVLVDQVPFNTLIITSKIFEIMPTGNPMLAIGPQEGDTARILRDTRTGVTFAPQTEAGLTDYILDQFVQWKRGKLNTGPRSFPAYERRNLVGELADVFNQLTA